MCGSLHGLSHATLLQLADGEHCEQQQDNEGLLKFGSQYKSAKLLEHAHTKSGCNHAW
jgi:hypothetical protein